MNSEVKFSHPLHEFVRSKTRKNIYRCVHPRCSYYIDKQFLEGKEAICHKCKSIFILTWAQLRNKYPVCNFCSKSPKAKELQAAKELVTNAMNDMPEDIKSLIGDN